MHPSWLLDGEIWRAFTYVFLSGTFFRWKLIGFFFLLMILFMLGNTIEEEFGTVDFLALFAISTLVPVVVSFLTWPRQPLVGAYFVYYTLMIIYGHRYGEAIFYMIIIPVKARWLAWAAVAFLALAILGSWRTGIPVAAGVGAAWGYYKYFLDGGRRISVRRGFRAARAVADRASVNSSAQANLEQFRETRRIAEEGTTEEKRVRIEVLEQGITPGVNICPPADFKPEADDQFCARCEGFNECSARWLESEMKTGDH